MKLSNAVLEIKKFWTDPVFPFQGGGEAKLKALESEFGRTFPPELREYIATVLSPQWCEFTDFGNVFCLYGFNELSKRTDYNFDSKTQEMLDEWSDDWFLIGDQGGDPIIVDLSESREYSCVLIAEHGEEEWNFNYIASSIGQFLLLMAAKHYALEMPVEGKAIIKDGRKNLLNEIAADWLFPRIQTWGPNYYDDWVHEFDNAYWVDKSTPSKWNNAFIDADESLNKSLDL